MLMLHLRRVLARLDAHAARGEPTAAAGEVRDEAVSSGAQVPAAGLETICACFGLTEFERDVLLLTAALELEPGAAARCAAAAGHPDRAYPTFGLALATLTDPHWDALTPRAPLRQWGLVQVVGGPGGLSPADGRGNEVGLTVAPLRIDERILHFLTGVSYLDERLRGLVRPVPKQAPAEGRAALPGSQRAVADQVTAGWQAHLDPADELPPVVELTGADPQTRREIAAAAAETAGLMLFQLNEADLPTEPAERDRIARLWQREAILLNAALLIEAAETGEPNGSRAALNWMLAALSVPVLLAAAEPVPDHSGRRTLRLSVPALPAAEQQEVWAGALNGTAVPGSEDGAGLGQVVAQFSLPAHAIRSAAAGVRSAGGPDPSPAELSRLTWEAGLTQARLALDELGRRVEPQAGWDDLVLPPEQLRTLRELTAHVRQRAIVHQQWGFDEVLRRGLGVTALFAGSSGTGKTLAAEVIAKELGLDLFVIDLSQVVSKYIGETEKNLRRVFDAAERGGAVLLFDEADALFGKRSEVKDSHDRYANIEVSYLLMRMEGYRGLAVLTSNLRKALDPAFLRRLRFVVDFPFPGVEERIQIWRRVIPDRAPTQGLDPARLAQLGVAGGSIRNIALSAAFLAADDGEPVQMRHVLTAAQTELLKSERAPTPAEVAGWV